MNVINEQFWKKKLNLLKYCYSGGSRICQTGVPTPETNLLFGNIFVENYMKVKEIGLEGVHVFGEHLHPSIVAQFLSKLG